MAKYVALGDSYASGQGAGSYTDMSCMVSSNGYPAQLDNAKGVKINLLRDPSCSGATTDQVIANQLSSLNKGTTLVTITAGANDVGLSALLGACVGGPSQTCTEAIATALAALPDVVTSVGTLIADVHQRAPRATIVVTGYVQPLSVSVYGEFAIAVNNGVEALNQAIENGIGLAAAQGASAMFVGVSFVGHQIGDDDSWLNSTPDSSFMHPTADGYTAYAQAILDALK